MMQGVLEGGRVVGIHIRRQDYLTNPNHHFVGLDYYKRALSQFPDDINIIVFSDDSKWCHEQSLFEDLMECSDSSMILSAGVPGNNNQMFDE